MKKEYRLTRNTQYTQVHLQGKSWANDLLVMKAFPNGLQLSRFGISVSKRVGNAVVRNRVKRLIRECIRMVHCKPGWDVIFISRSSASRASYCQIDSAVRLLLSRAKLMEQQL